MNEKKIRTVEDILFIIGHALVPTVWIIWSLLLKYENTGHWGCWFNQITGLYCLSCGGTRAFGALLKGKLIQSVRYNPVVLYVFVCYVWFMASWYIQKLSKNRILCGMKFRVIYVYLGLVILIVQCIVKNILLFI